MKRFALLLLVAACEPDIDFDFDLDLGFGGPIDGKYGAVTFASVDGCVGGDPFWGCPKTLPMFAIGSQARFVVGTTSGKPDDEKRLARAHVESVNDAVAVGSRDDGGFLVIDSVGTGSTSIRIVEDGEVIDEIDVSVDAIASLEGNRSATPPLVLAGAAYPADVLARGRSGLTLFAHGAIAAQPLDGLSIDPDVRGWFYNSSEQFAIKGDYPGAGGVQFFADTISAESRFRIVSRKQITEVKIEPLFPGDEPTNKVTLTASTFVDGELVNGGPGCFWRIVSGGGPDAVLSPAVGTAFTRSLFVIYDSAILYGSGETVVECRANKQVAAQYTLMLAPQ